MEKLFPTNPNEVYTHTRERLVSIDDSSSLPTNSLAARMLRRLKQLPDRDTLATTGPCQPGSLFRFADTLRDRLSLTELSGLIVVESDGKVSTVCPIIFQDQIGTPDGAFDPQPDDLPVGGALSPYAYNVSPESGRFYVRLWLRGTLRCSQIALIPEAASVAAPIPLDMLTDPGPGDLRPALRGKWQRVIDHLRAT